MKNLFFLILIISSFGASAQLLNPFEEWFTLEHYFLPKELRKHQIRHLHIRITEKPDGEKIYDRGTFLHYEFDAEGRLTKAYKSLKRGSDYDTATVDYFYNSNGMMYKREEINPPFKIRYYYQFQEGQPISELKIDYSRNQPDTIYQRLFEYSTQGNQRMQIVKNSEGKPFIRNTLTYDFDQRLVSDKELFLSNGNYIEKVYSYDPAHLTDKVKIRRFRSEFKEAMHFEYKVNQIDWITIEENGEMTSKMGFTYREDDLPSALVQRFYKEKKIRIHEFYYYKTINQSE